MTSLPTLLKPATSVSPLNRWWQVRRFWVTSLPIRQQHYVLGTEVTPWGTAPALHAWGSVIPVKGRTGRVTNPGPARAVHTNQSLNTQQQKEWDSSVGKGTRQVPGVLTLGLGEENQHPLTFSMHRGYTRVHPYMSTQETNVVKHVKSQGSDRLRCEGNIKPDNCAAPLKSTCISSTTLMKTIIFETVVQMTSGHLYTEMSPLRFLAEHTNSMEK